MLRADETRRIVPLQRQQSKKLSCNGTVAEAIAMPDDSGGWRAWIWHVRSWPTPRASSACNARKHNGLPRGSASCSGRLGWDCWLALACWPAYWPADRVWRMQRTSLFVLLHCCWISRRSATRTALLGRRLPTWAGCGACWAHHYILSLAIPGALQERCWDGSTIQERAWHGIHGAHPKHGPAAKHAEEECRKGHSGLADWVSRVLESWARGHALSAVRQQPGADTGGLEQAASRTWSLGQENWALTRSSLPTCATF
jgi:hypothetical protein